MALSQFSSGQVLNDTDLDVIVDHLQGAVGSTDAWHFRSSAGNDFLITLSDNAGARKFSIRDSDGNEVFSVDSDGLLTAASTTFTTLDIPTSASPSQTVDGRAVWDSDDDVLTIGDGTSRKTFRPATTVLNYKSATQVFTTDTTFADVIGANAATFAFAIGANEIWIAEYYIPMAFGGTGGAKFQLTGPGSPTGVDISGYSGDIGHTDGGATVQASVISINPVTAFSSSVWGKNSAAGLTAGAYNANADNFINIIARIINGANAGTVTLQAAQNSSNSTTTLGLGSYMRAEKIV